MHKAKCEAVSIPGSAFCILRSAIGFQPVSVYQFNDRRINSFRILPFINFIKYVFSK